MKFYDWRTIGTYLGMLVALALICKVSSGIGFTVLVPALLYFMMAGNDVALLTVLFITVCGMVTNPFFMPKSLVFNITHKVVLLTAASVLATRVLGRRQSQVLTPLLSLIPYLIFMAVSSQLGWQPIISNLKMVLFVLSFFALFGGAVMAMRRSGNERQLRSMMLAVMIFYVFGSVLLTRLGGIGYMAAEEAAKDPTVVSLFMGMANHSQALGPLMAVFGVMIFADWMFAIQKFDKLYAALMVCCPYLIWITSSRTALASFLAGIMMVVYFTVKAYRVKKRWRQAVAQLATLTVVVGLMAVIVLPQVRNKVEHFVVKYEDQSRKAQLSSKSIWKSREGKMEALLYNFKRSPIIGNGFQVSADMENRKGLEFRDYLSAPVEKCIWTYAVLEEGGMIGMALFAFFLLVSWGLMVRRKAYIGASMLFVVLMTNFGEFAIFSMSALGGVFWFMIFLGLIFDHKRAAAERLAAEIAMFQAMAPGMPLPPHLRKQLKR